MAQVAPPPRTFIDMFESAKGHDYTSHAMTLREALKQSDTVCSQDERGFVTVNKWPDYHDLAIGGRDPHGSDAERSWQNLSLEDVISILSQNGLEAEGPYWVANLSPDHY